MTELVLIPKGVRKGIVKIKHADNQFNILINGTYYWYAKTEGDPVLDIDVPFEIGARGLTTVTLLGVNWGGPASFDYELLIEGCKIKPEPYYAPQTDMGIAWSKTYSLLNQEDYGDLPSKMKMPKSGKKFIGKKRNT